MGKKILTASAAQEVLRLRADVDDWGDPKMSAAEIAGQLGCSESTVWRVIKKQSAYARTPNRAVSMDAALEVIRQQAPAVTDVEVAESLERLKGLITKEKDPEARKAGMFEGLTEEASARLRTYI